MHFFKKRRLTHQKRLIKGLSEGESSKDGRSDRKESLSKEGEACYMRGLERLSYNIKIERNAFNKQKHESW